MSFGIEKLPNGQPDYRKVWDELERSITERVEFGQSEQAAMKAIGGISAECANIEELQLILAAGADANFLKDMSTKTTAERNETYCLFFQLHEPDVVALLFAAGFYVDQSSILYYVKYSYPSHSLMREIALNHTSHPLVETARKQITRVGLSMILERAIAVCIALQDLQLDALRLIEILKADCAPFAAQLPFHYLWHICTTVKHWHDKHPKKEQQ